MLRWLLKIIWKHMCRKLNCKVLLEMYIVFFEKIKQDWTQPIPISKIQRMRQNNNIQGIETGLLGSKPIETPMDPNMKFCMDQGKVLSNPERYRCLVGSSSHHDSSRYILCNWCYESVYGSSPVFHNGETILQIGRYLKSYPGRGLLYRSNGHLWVEAFTYSDWTGLPSNRKSTTDITLFYGNTWSL